MHVLNVDIDECDNQTLINCTEDNNQLCKNTQGSYDCVCKLGFVEKTTYGSALIECEGNNYFTNFGISTM